jgi:hypothetical protein
MIDFPACSPNPTHNAIARAKWRDRSRVPIYAFT